jgi:hypothetical protein
MSARATIIMVVLAALAVVAAAWLTRGQSATAVASSEARPLLTAAQLPRKGVERIILQRAGQQPQVFQRTAEGWMQIQPFHFPMDEFSIEQFLKLAQEAMVLESIDPARTASGQSLSLLGLEPPAATIRYEWPTGATSIDFGRRGVAGRAYVRVQGDANVHVIDHALHDRAVTMDPKEWRSRRLFPDGPAANAADADELLLSAGGQRVALRREHKRWWMVEPVRTRLDPAAMETLQGALGRAVSSGFMLDEPQDLARFGLEPPAGALTISGKAPGQTNAQVQRLLIGSLIGAGGQDRFGMVEGRPVLIRLGAPVLAALFPTRESLVQPTASGVLGVDVKSIRISGPDGDFTLTRDLDRWRAPDSGNVEVDRRLVEQLLTYLTELRASRVAFEPFPRDRQLAFVTLTGFSGKPLDTIRVARQGPDAEWIMDNGDSVQRRYPAATQVRLTPAEFGLQPAAIAAPGGESTR